MSVIYRFSCRHVLNGQIPPATTTPVSWTTIKWSIIPIKFNSKELWPRNRFQVNVHCDLDLGDMTLGQSHDTSLSHGKQLFEILSRSNMVVMSYGPDTAFGYVCTVTLTLEVWSWVKVMTHPWVMDNNCVKYYPDPTWQWGVMARTRISGMCALWPWSRRCDLWSRSWHTLGSWTRIVWNIIQIQYGSDELWPGHRFLVCVHYDLDLGEMTLGQGHDTPLGHGQQLCEILFRSNLVVRSNGSDKIFGYVCTMTLTLGHGQQLCEILSRSDEGVRSYGQDTMWIDGQTDGQGDSYIPPPKLCLFFSLKFIYIFKFPSKERSSLTQNLNK